MAIRIKNNIVIYDDEVVRVGANTQANRPASPSTGMIRFDTTANTFEGYDGTQWGPLGGGGNPLESYSKTIGDGSNTSFTIAHLLNDDGLFVNVYENATDYIVYPDITYVDANTLTVTFVDAPTTNAYNVVVYGSDLATDAYASLIGSGTSNTATITHNLNSYKILISIRNVATGYYVYPDIQLTSANSANLQFVNTITTNQYFVTVLGY